MTEKKTFQWWTVNRPEFLDGAGLAFQAALDKIHVQIMCCRCLQSHYEYVRSIEATFTRLKKIAEI